jgi:Mg2+-importing ATPase
MVCLGPWSSVFDIITFAYLYFYYGIKSKEEDVALFQTTWFTVGLLTQALIIHMIRTPKVPFLQSSASGPVLLMTFATIGVCLALPYIPFISNFLTFVRIDTQTYLFILLVVLAYCVSTQVVKLIYIKVFKTWY